MTSRSASADSIDSVQVGRILRSHGVRGEVKVEVQSDVPDRFKAGAQLGWTDRGGRSRSLRIERVRPDRGTLLVVFEGIQNREQADELRGGHLVVDASQSPDPPEGFYYYHQLTGCHCFDRREGELGQVTEVLEDGGGCLLRVAGGERAILVPFVDAFLVEVDVDRQRIDLDLPEGLIEACTS
ncbi:MAG: ribosome maturation factor RimM [Acidobacteriota bacterium]